MSALTYKIQHMALSNKILAGAVFTLFALTTAGLLYLRLNWENYIAVLLN